jgi:hypothetical protein
MDIAARTSGQTFNVDVVHRALTDADIVLVLFTPDEQPALYGTSVARIDAFAHRSDCSGCACDGGGRAEERRCWCNRPRSPAGIGKGCGDVGAVDCGGDPADHASKQNFEPSFGGWPVPTRNAVRLVMIEVVSGSA